MHRRIIIEDTTLRDGEQAPGVALSMEEKLAIAQALDGAGVPMIEVGTASMGGQEKRFIEKVVSMGLGATLVGWNRADLNDIKCSIGCGLKALHIGAPTSDIQLRAGPRRDREWLYREITKLIEYCKARDVFVSVSAEDASRTPREHVLRYARVIRDAGADRMRLSDTLGLFTPFEYHELVGAVVDEVGIDVQLHTHNDFGLAMGNVIAGVRAGARYVHATVNGWGERVGLVGLEVVAVGLKRILGIDTGIDTFKLVPLSGLVSRLFRRDVPPWQPIVGRDVFVHESGIHVSGTIEDVGAFEPFPPEWIGSSHSFVAGKHSGSRAIQYILNEAGISVSRDESARLLPLVRERAIELKRPLTKTDLLELRRELKEQ